MHTRPCWVEISTRALEDNYRFLASLAGPHVELLAIVKANAYGHALKLCAPAVINAGARWLGVTSVEEGIEARRFCPDVRILVIGGAFPGQGRDIVRHKLICSSEAGRYWPFSTQSVSVPSTSNHGQRYVNR